MNDRFESKLISVLALAIILFFCAVMVISIIGIFILFCFSEEITNILSKLINNIVKE